MSPHFLFMQEIVIAIILLLCVGYAAYRIYRAVKRANDPCYGCEGCALRDQMKKKTCDKRK